RSSPATGCVAATVRGCSGPRRAAPSAMHGAITTTSRATRAIGTERRGGGARRGTMRIHRAGARPMADQDEQRNGIGRAQAEEAVRTLLRWAGEDPAREGLLDTPKRVVDAYGDWFSGYADDPREYLERTFEEVAGYDEMIVLRDIEFESHCEHHMAPIIGKAH